MYPDQKSTLDTVHLGAIKALEEPLHLHLERLADSKYLKVGHQTVLILDSRDGTRVEVDACGL